MNNGLAGGGTERESTSFANYLAAKGYKVKIVASHKSEHFYKLHESIHFIEPNFFRNAHSLIVYTFKLILFIRSEIRNSGSKKVLSYNETLNPYVIMSCAGCKVDVFVRESMHPKAYLPLTTRILKRIFYPRSKRVFAQTNYGSKVLIQQFGLKNVEVFPNPVEIFYKSIPSERANCIVSVGRLEKVKGHKYLIEAFSRLSNPHWTLEIVGDGSLRNDLIDLARQLGVSDRVVFHGHMKDFESILRRSKIFVLPSIKEGFPNALVEAMSIPLACIAGDYYKGYIEIIEHNKNGLLFTPENVEELTYNLDKLTNSGEFRMKLMKEAVKVREKYSMEVVGEDLIQELNIMLR